MFSEEDAEKIASAVKSVLGDEKTAQAQALKNLPVKEMLTGAGILGAGGLGGGALYHSSNTRDKLKKNIADAAQHSNQLQQTLRKNVLQDRQQQQALNKAMLSSAARDRQLRDKLKKMMGGAQEGAGDAAQQAQGGQPPASQQA